jgi:hypothetical protein
LTEKEVNEYKLSTVCAVLRMRAKDCTLAILEMLHAGDKFLRADSEKLGSAYRVFQYEEKMNVMRVNPKPTLEDFVALNTKLAFLGESVWSEKEY